MARFLKYEARDGIVVLTMNQPETRNALAEESQLEELVEACRRVDNDRSVRVAILTGRGSAFCAGGDVKAMAERSGMFAGAPPRRGAS